jgi:hypothetical protein
MVNVQWDNGEVANHIPRCELRGNHVDRDPLHFKEPRVRCNSVSNIFLFLERGFISNYYHACMII